MMESGISRVIGPESEAASNTTIIGITITIGTSTTEIATNTEMVTETDTHMAMTNRKGANCRNAFVSQRKLYAAIHL